ncbi:MAG: type II toxin-antitoxin system VapC family toxin [candidate division WWE3 bacterium]|nr:type II toxin-antitoxin system VapC family toxin [candidate division WWE3 bacterium]
MSYLLDTNVVIDHIRKRSRIQRGLIKDGLSLSIISLAELFHGAVKSSNSKFNLELIYSTITDWKIEVLKVDTPVSLEYAEIRNELEKSGQKLENFDILIAATARIYNKTLVTNNRKHFERIKNLKILE